MLNNIKLTAGEKVFHSLSSVIMILLALTILYPLLNVIAQSFTEPMAVLSGRVTILPINPTIETYRIILRSKLIVTGFTNSLIYMVAGTIVNLIVTILCAYPLSRKELSGRGVFMFIFTFTMMFSGGMIPTYLIIKSLGLLDTRLVMILPGAMAVYNMILARTFFLTSIPQELYESAGLDGASDLRTLISVVLPLSAPIVAVLALFYAVGHWNSYFNAMMYLSSSELFNIQLVLRNAISNISSLMDSGENMTNLNKTMATQEAAKYAIIVIAMVPVLIIYPFVQKHFVKGIMIGSLKG